MTRRLSQRVLKRLRSNRGTSLVEAAILTPLLLLLTFAIVDFATVFYIYLALENGVSQAGRYGVTGQVMGSLTREQSMMTAMRQATPTLTIPDSAFSFSNLPPGGTVWLSGSGGPNDIAKISVTYTWNVMTPLINQMFPGGQITMTVESAMKNEPF